MFLEIVFRGGKVKKDDTSFYSEVKKLKEFHVKIHPT